MNHRLLLAVLTLLATLWLPGCGPGTGGTGGGEASPALSYFDATAASICDGTAGSTLSCSAGNQVVVVVGAASLTGSGPVLLAEAASANNTSAVVLGNHIDFVARCAGLSFSGDWGIRAATGDARYWGQAQSGSQAPQYASLSLRPSDDGSGTIAMLRDAEERTLLGPVLLRRVEPVLPPPGACPAR